MVYELKELDLYTLVSSLGFFVCRGGEKGKEKSYDRPAGREVWRGKGGN